MEFTVADEGRPRLDQFLSAELPDFSRSRLQKLIRNGACLIDGAPALDPDARLLPGQIINLFPPPTSTTLIPEKGEVRVVWQSPHAIVCDKPAGLTVHPCPSQPDNTLIQRLLEQYPEISAMEGFRPGVVHRLDKDTSGLLIVALDEKTRLRLTEDFANRRVYKEYLALVSGSPPDKGECLEPIGRHPALKTKMAIVQENAGGKRAKTAWTKLWQGNGVALLSVRIHTGRTHQIRVHLANRGFPILGDKLYAPPNVKNMAPRQMLSAHKLAFDNPSGDGRVELEVPPPDDFYQAILNNEARPKRVVIVGSAGSGKSAFRKALGERGVPVISADEIVGRLYSGPGHVGDWLERNGGADCLNPEGGIEKSRLFAWLGESDSRKKNFESFVHNLVADEILSFWHAHPDSDILAAEIPLYFESPSRKRYDPRPLVAGVSCDKNIRRARLKETRGWSDEKISAIDGWQLPEETKLSRCDVVIENNSDLKALNLKADAFLADVRDSLRREREKLLHDIKKLCGDSA